MSEEERALRLRARDDFPDFYAPKCLVVRPKVGGDEPLILNFAQRYIHARLEAQIKAIGKVRAVILKGRQMGCTTYVEGRFYHKVTHRRGVKAFILTHLADATNTIFAMVERYHDNMNPLLKPVTGASNAKELDFKLLDSGYRVGTAGTASVGRSDTFQYFHGSEVGFWENADGIATGVMQTIPNQAGTEIILESTAQGLGNYFADMWSIAESGKSEYIAIFVPWFWDEGYRAPVPPGFELDGDEQIYFDTYHSVGLVDLEQMVWRRFKIVDDFKGDIWKFAQEYPANPQEAFQSSGDGSYIKPITVMKARKTIVMPEKFIPIIIGIDPARGGRDSTSVIDRQGRRAGRNVYERWKDADVTVQVGKTIKLIQAIKPAKVIIDSTEGTGAAMCDLLWEAGYRKTVYGVKFSQSATDDENYLNKRAEIWAEMKAWLESNLGVQIPDDDSLQAQLCAAIWGEGATKHNSRGQLQIESKDHIKKRLKGASPDDADALACTFAVPIKAAEISDDIEIPINIPADSGAGY